MTAILPAERQAETICRPSGTDHDPGEHRPVSAGRWQLDELLARGGMAELWLAHETISTARRVVVKRMRPELVDEPHFADMFREEARLGRLLQHGAIARLLEVGDDRGEPFLVLEHVDGIDLRAALATLRHWGQDMPPVVAVYVAREVLRALSYVHSAVDEQGLPLGLVHRDVSPANILLSAEGEVKLCDFGVAKVQANRTSGRWLKGKVRYMAPEQTRAEPVDARTDQFAVGAVLCEMLTGRPRFRGGSQDETAALVREGGLPEDVRLGVPAEPRLRRILSRALAPVAVDRFPDAETFAAELWGWLVDVGAPDPVPMLRDFVRRSRDPLGEADAPAPPRRAHAEGDEEVQADRTLSEPTRSDMPEAPRAPLFLIGLAIVLLAGLLTWATIRFGDVALGALAWPVPA